jgi:hypothetical protein
VPGGRIRLRESRGRADFFFGDSSFTELAFEFFSDPNCDAGFEDEGDLLVSLGVSKESIKR